MNITVFTPTYNRAHKLPALYESLCRQSNQSFVWLIVDDGSTDNTESIVKKWANEKKVQIQYYKQANGGKMRAHNYGVTLCTTDFFVCVDSDDYLTDNAVEVIADGIHKSKTGLLLLLRKSIIGKDNSTDLPDKEYITLHELYKSGFRGETTIVFRTDIIRRFPFNVVEGEKFITETSVYDLIDQEYEYLFVPEAITVCEYMPDGYTKNLIKLFRNNPCGYVNYYCQAARLYGEKELSQKAYMYTYFIKDSKKRKQYRDNSFTLEDKVLGSLRYIKTMYRAWKK